MPSAPHTASDPVEPADLAVLEHLGESWCERLEPAVLAGSDAAGMAERLAFLVRRLQAAQLTLAPRAADCNAYAARATSAADWLAHQNGISIAQAKRALDTTRRLETCPDTKDAFLAGEISADEAEAVTDAAKADPRSEQRLLDGARARHDIRETRQAADKVRRAANSAEDEQARHARLHHTRGLRIGESADGHVEIRGRFTPAAFATVKPVIDAHMRLRVEQARRDGTRDGWDGYRADAFLAAIAAGGSGATTTRPAAKHPPAATATATAHTEAPTADTEADNEGRLFVPGDDIGSADGLDPKVNWNLVVLVDGIALKRGYAAPGETCEIPGIGPIPVAWIETLLPHVHTEMLIHDSVDIRAYATNTRHRTRPVELAVRVRDRDCVIPRCHRDPTEFDHRVPFADTHDTSVANGNRVCTPDHRDKTHHGSTLDRDDTHWRCWPPGTDPTATPPMTAPIGQHLTTWNLDHLPGHLPLPGDGPADDPPSLDLN